MFCYMLSESREVACREDLVTNKTDQPALLVAEVLPQYSVGQMVEFGQGQVAQRLPFYLIFWGFLFSPHFPHHPPHILRDIEIMCDTMILQMVFKPRAQGLRDTPECISMTTAGAFQWR